MARRMGTCVLVHVRACSCGVVSDWTPPSPKATLPQPAWGCGCQAIVALDPRNSIGLFRGMLLVSQRSPEMTLNCVSRDQQFVFFLRR